MAITDDDLRKLSEYLRLDRLHDCPLADPAALEKHEKHHEYIDAAIQREMDRAAIRKAVIEKSLTGLIWSAIVAAAGWFASHFTFK